MKFSTSKITLLVLPLIVTLIIFIVFHEEILNSSLETIEISKFEYQATEITDGAEIKILSFSDGKECTKNTTYYFSIIAIDKSNGDTVRILTPCQLLSPNFDLGFYNKPNKSTDSILISLGHKPLKDRKEKYVLINLGNAYQRGNFKVTFGSISFEDDENKMIKEHLKKDGIDTTLIEEPK